VLWDTSDPSVANWTVTDLSDLALSNGSAGIFARLARAYSVATNSAGKLVITGLGYDTNNPANPRAFLLTVTTPKTVAISRPVVVFSSAPATGFTLQFQSAASVKVTYYLEYTTSLPPVSGWTAVSSVLGNGGWTALSDPNPADGRRFYRIRAQ